MLVTQIIDKIYSYIEFCKTFEKICYTLIGIRDDVSDMCEIKIYYFIFL